MRFARIGLLCAILAMSSGALTAGAAVAAPPTLTGVEMAYHPYYGDALNSQAFTCRDTSDGGTTFRVSLGQSSETGPYAGNLHTAFDVVLGVQGSGDGGIGRKVKALSGNFTIDSPEGQVTAALSLDKAPEPGGDCYEGGPILLTAEFRYTATIITREGVFADRGRGTVSWFKSMGSRNRIYDYVQRFTSDLTAPEQSESALFGQRVPGGSWSAMSANTKRASPFVLYYPATVRKVYAYIDGRGATSGSQTIRAVLYRRDPAGGPGRYVTRSFEYAVPAGTEPHWQPLWLAPIPRLDPGVYWIGLQSGPANGVARFAWNSKPNSRRYNIDPFADGATDPFGTSFSDDQQMSVLAAGSY